MGEDHKYSALSFRRRDWMAGAWNTQQLNIMEKAKEEKSFTQ